jgi:hypothetical protein
VLLLLALLLPDAVHAQDENRAGLVILHGDGRVTQQCVAFAEESISGYELLQRAGPALSVEAGSMGATVCSIDGEGCSYPAESCFCRCQGSPCVYWSYWRLQAEGGWRYQPLGAGNTQVRDGDVEAWRWAEGTKEDAPEPPPASFAAICAPESASSELGQAQLLTATAAAQTAPADAATSGSESSAQERAPVATAAPASDSDLTRSPAHPLTPSSSWLLFAGVLVLPAAGLLVWALARRRR